MKKRVRRSTLGVLALLTVSLVPVRLAIGSDAGGSETLDAPIIAERSRPSSDDPAWIADRGHLQALLKEHACDKVWKTLWPWAKRGNMEARFLIFMLMVPPPDADILYAPGNSGDYATTMRDALVMAVHSFDFEEESRERADYARTALSMFSGKSGRWERFARCARSGKRGCGDIAVKDKLVPSFEDYALQIDALMDKGMTGSCLVIK